MTVERTLTAAVKTAIDQPTVGLAIFCQIGFPSSTVRIWSGITDITWNAQTWSGAGASVGYSAFPERTDGSSQGLQIVLSGIDSATIANADEEFQGASVDVWLAVIDAGSVVADPVKTHGGLLDTADIDDDGTQATITFASESKLIRQLQPIQYRYTHEDQKRLYPGANDKGLDQVPTLQDKSVIWRN